MIPANIAICKRDFSKQNLTKSSLHSSLKLVTLDALNHMHISYANIAIENINWNVVLIFWRSMKDCRIHPL